jgi:hypothetical protein
MKVFTVRALARSLLKNLTAKTAERRQAKIVYSIHSKIYDFAFLRIFCGLPFSLDLSFSASC